MNLFSQMKAGTCFLKNKFDQSAGSGYCYIAGADDFCFCCSRTDWSAVQAYSSTAVVHSSIGRYDFSKKKDI